MEIGCLCIGILQTIPVAQSNQYISIYSDMLYFFLAAFAAKDKSGSLDLAAARHVCKHNASVVKFDAAAGNRAK